MAELVGIPFAGFFWYAGLRGFITALDLTMRGRATTGTVTSIVRDVVLQPPRYNTRAIYAHPAVQFEPVGGEPITLTHTSSGAYRVGQVVPVLYDPTDPRRAVINNVSNLWVGSGLAMTGGAAILLLSLWGHPLAMGAVVFLSLVAAALNTRIIAAIGRVLAWAAIILIVGFVAWAAVTGGIRFQPRPDVPPTPFIQVCPHEDFDFSYGVCRNGQAITLSLDGFADDDVLVNNGYAFGSTTLRFRVYKRDASGDHLYGTAMTSDLDPTWKATDWSLQALWDSLTLAEGTGDAPTPPAPGQYRIEVLDHAGRYLTETRFNLQWSPHARQTATPVDQTGS
jgi:hypothetical protein